jgi:hypothetical protein
LAVTTEIIQDALHGNQPFKVLTADSRCIEVPHPDFAMLSPSGRILHVALENDHTEAFDIRLVVSIQKKNGVSSS